MPHPPSHPGAGDPRSSLPPKWESIDAPPPSRPHDAQDPYYGGPHFDEEDEEGGLLEYWRILRRRKGTLILGAILGLLIAIAFTLPQAPIYQAKATLEIQSFNQNFMNMSNIQEVNEGSGPGSGMVDIQTQIKILQSETLLERVLSLMSRGEPPPGIDDKPQDSRLSAWRRALNLPEQDIQDDRTLALAMASGSLKVRASGQTRIVEVLVDSTDPAIAAEFANLLANEYIDQSMEARFQSSQRTGEWLTKQLDDFRIKLERSEDTLQQYAQHNNLLYTANDVNIDDEKLKQLQDQLTTAQGDRIAKQTRWETASAAPPESLPDVLNDGSMRNFQDKIADLRRQRDELLEIYTTASPRVSRVVAQIDSLEASFTNQRNQILRRIRNEFEESLRKERLLQADYDKQMRLVTVLREKAIQYNILKREVETNRQLYESMLARVKEAGLASALKASNVRIVDQAKPPERPYKPRLPLNALLGLLAGGFLAVAFVVTTEKADRALREPSDLTFYLGVRELGVVPSGSILEERKPRLLGRGKKNTQDNNSLTLTSKPLDEKLELVTLQRRLSSLAEAFRATLTSIHFSGNGKRGPRLIVVTSPGAREGKTTVAMNLAVAMAETRHKVLVIDGDTRRPRVHSILEVPNEAGLTDLLMPDGGDWQSRIRETDVPNLFVLPAGPGLAAVSNMLHSRRLIEGLGWCRENFDFVVIDSPPMLQIPDARLLGKIADGVVLVVRAGSTTRDAAVACRVRLREDRVNLIGTVMNDWNPRDSPGGYYGYYGKYSYYDRHYQHRDDV